MREIAPLRPCPEFLVLIPSFGDCPGSGVEFPRLRFFSLVLRPRCRVVTAAADGDAFFVCAEDAAERWGTTWCDSSIGPRPLLGESNDEEADESIHPHAMSRVRTGAGGHSLFQRLWRQLLRRSHGGEDQSGDGKEDARDAQELRAAISREEPRLKRQAALRSRPILSHPSWYFDRSGKIPGEWAPHEFGVPV